MTFYLLVSAIMFLAIAWEFFNEQPATLEAMIHGTAAFSLSAYGFYLALSL